MVKPLSINVPSSNEVLKENKIKNKDQTPTGQKKSIKKDIPTTITFLSSWYNRQNQKNENAMIRNSTCRNVVRKLLVDEKQ